MARKRDIEEGKVVYIRRWKYRPTKFEVGIVKCKKRTPTGLTKCKIDRLGEKYDLPHTYDSINEAFKTVKKVIKK